MRALVDHVVGANVRYELLLHGAPLEQVEATRAVDHLGDDPVAAFLATAARVVAAFREDGALGRTAHHATGDRTGLQLLGMRVLDVTVHAWDLARALGAEERLDDDLVASSLAWTDDLDLGPPDRAFAPAAGAVPHDASSQERLLHRLGRHPSALEVR